MEIHFRHPRGSGHCSLGRNHLSHWGHWFSPLRVASARQRPTVFYMVLIAGESILGLDRTLLLKLQDGDHPPPVLFYILLRRYRVSLLTSSLSALFLLLTSANFYVWPKVNHFELLVLLAFLILAAIPKSWTLGFAILAFGCLLAAYIRPEMFFAFVLCFAISVGSFLFRERTLFHVAPLASLALSLLPLRLSEIRSAATAVLPPLVSIFR